MLAAALALRERRALGEGDEVCAAALRDERLDGGVLRVDVVLRAPLGAGISDAVRVKDGLKAGLAVEALSSPAETI